jgi:threonine/homoserine/homoserine lactone efflux protein
MITCLLNPKLGVFFVAFLPQFIPAGSPVATTSLALAGVQAGEAVLWYLLLGRLAAGARRFLDRASVRSWLDRITATVFVGFGLRLAAEG